jgi:hypothetical protein
MRLVRWIGPVLIAASLAIAAVGFWRHDLRLASFGVTTLILQVQLAASEWFQRRRGPRVSRWPNPGQLLTDVLKALALSGSLLVVWLVVLSRLVPSWFPASCPLPPRH